MKLLSAIMALLLSDIAFADAAPTSQTYAAQHVDQFRNGTPGMMIFKGEEDNNAYMLQGNPDTGAMLVEGSFAVDILAQGENGEPIPDFSLLMGGNSSGDLIPIKVGADGTVATSGTSTVSGTVAATQSGTWTVQPGNTANTTPWLSTISQGGNSATVSAGGGLKTDVSNLPTTADTNLGAPGASTVRTAAMLGVGSTAVSNANPVPISDAGGTITVDGTVAATQSGTWTVQPGNTANTTPWLATISQGGNSATVSAGGALKVDASGGTQTVTGTVAVSNLPATVDTNSGAASASTVRTTQASRSYSDSARYNYAGGTVTTSAWVEVDSSTAAAFNLVCITDQSGQIMELGTGAAASETRVFLIARGFSGCIPLTIAASTRLAIKAVSASATTGDLVISGMQ